MTRAASPTLGSLIALAVALASCGKDVARGTSGVGGPCSAATDCVRGLTCASGVCALPPGAALCTPGARVCDGPDVDQCDATGQGQTFLMNCPNGCKNGACVDPTCTSGARECSANGSEVDECIADAQGTLGWHLLEPCPAGCDAATNSCLPAVCKPLDVRCSPTAPDTVQVCAADGSGWVDGPGCAAGSYCSAGVCTAQACVPGQASCDGNQLVVCNAQGSGSTSSACAHGCLGGACIQATCTPGSSQCAGNAVQTCLPDGSGYAQSASCGTSPCEAIAPGVAACPVPVCSPLSKRCSGDSVQTCLADGSGWTSGDPCGAGATCSSGICTAPPAACTEGTDRCLGSTVQQCTQSVWVTIGACLGSCGAGGVCTGGSCGASVPVAVALPACASSTCPPPADGFSTLLAVAGPLVDSSGAPLADGTLITVAATGTAVITAADADPSTPGIQVRSVSGFADFAFRGPGAEDLANDGDAAHVTVSAAVGGNLACAGSASVDFAASSGQAYVAEDFTTSARRDALATTADWRTDLGVTESRAFLFGTGADGPLDLSSLPAGSSWDLAATPRGAGLPPFAPSLQVVGLTAQSAQVQGSVAGFAAGDEVMLIELQGASLTSSSAAGSYEYLTIASATDGNVSFTAAILGTYGASPGAPIAGEKVVLQRIPQLTNVTVPTGVVLTASSWDGTLGGILAFRANGTVSVAGSISADAIGYRAGSSTTPTQNQAGESFDGQPAPASTASARNAGAGGGGYLLCDPAHLDQIESWFGAGGSYGTSGASGSSAGTPPAALLAGRSPCLSAQGMPYGTPTLARLFPGSGSGTQQLNGRAACTTSSCPGESRGPGYVPGNPSALDYPAALVSDLSDGSPPLQSSLGQSFSFCAAETKSYQRAYQTGGAASCDSSGDANGNASCAATFAACGTQAAASNGASLTLSHAAFGYADDAPCTSGACADTAAFCSADTQSYGQAWEANGSSCDTASNPNCAATYAACSAYSHAFPSSTCIAGTSCSTTFDANNCGRFDSAPYPAAGHPCLGNAACMATFAACGATNLPASNTSACVADCPRLGANYSHSCSSCGGCTTWNQRYCTPNQTSNGEPCGSPSSCSYAGESGVYSGHDPFLCSDCNSNEYCDSSFGCGFLDADACCDWNLYYCQDGSAVDGICPANGNAACNSCSICLGASGTSCATNPNAAGCDNYCETSAGCTTNPGCTHNPGCTINPGCSTNVGCETSSGCDTCGGRTSWDGAFCDFTNPSNSCACPSPWADETQGGRGGGILFVSALSLDLSGGGTVSARGGAPGTPGKPGFAGGSGGSLWVRAGSIKLAASAGLQLDASGGVNAGAGRVRLERAGGDDPVVLSRISPLPYTPAFSLPQVQSVSLLPAGLHAISAQLIPLADASTTSLLEGAPPLVTQLISSDGGLTFMPVLPGISDVFSAETSDVRFREVFAPRPGPVARSAGLAWLIQLQ